MKKLLPFLFLVCSAAAQQPQTHTAPIYSTNAKYVQGIGPGYWPQAGAGLVLNLAAGRTRCANTMTNYAGGTLTLANNTTNYVFLDTTSSCAPTSNTSGYTSTGIAIATVVTSSGVITTITDDRVFGLANPSSGATGTVTSVATTAPITGGTITGTGTIACATCAVGPGSSTANHLAKFSGTDGITLADGGAIPTGFTLQAGVPTGSGSAGSYVAVTDGAPGGYLYTYVGNYSGLPTVVNWGTGAITTTGAMVVTMQRAVTSGNYLVGCVFCTSGACTVSQNTGWTQLFINNGATPAIEVTTKVAGGTEAGNTAITPWSSVTYNTGDVALLVEVTNFNSGTPVRTSNSAASAAGVTGLVTGDLALIFYGGDQTRVTVPSNAGSGHIPFGWQYTLGANYGSATGYALPNVVPITGMATTPTQISPWEPTGVTVGIVIMQKNGTSASNLWVPIG